jgi:hypothetical protein
MTDYLRFRELLASRCMVSYFDDEAEVHDWYGASRRHVVSVPARYDIVAAQDLIDTARWLADTFGA